VDCPAQSVQDSRRMDNSFPVIIKEDLKFKVMRDE
jgi:hypothetical protein